MTQTQTIPGVELRGPQSERAAEVLTPEALAFAVELQRKFGATREALLRARQERQAAFDGGALPGFLPETRHVREGDWRVAPVPADLQNRRVEITGPVDRKMMINALNSGAPAFMVDFEDSNTPSWDNLLDGHVNLTDAIERTIEFHQDDGRVYRLGEKPAVMLLRPRGWHLPEKHVLVDGQPMSGSLFDFGVYVHRNAKRLLDKGSGPYFYLPKLESHLEARLWNDVFAFAQERLGIPKGTVKATVLIETLPAAFEMEEILYELRDHSAGLNAGRWDYIFSCIKKLRNHADKVLPDRVQVTMTVPHMRAYTELLVKTCHKRGAFAMGGMAAFIPSRRNPEINATALSRVREDKERESRDGFDGTWVAHPDLVPVALEVFDGVLGERPNQLEKQRPDVQVTEQQLLAFDVPGGAVTEAGVRLNISVGIQYIESWLRGNGAAAINNLMEDAATAEISRAQVWQWIRHGVRLSEGQPVTRELARQYLHEEVQALRQAWGDALVAKSRLDDAARLFEQVALDEHFVEFLTLPAYEQLA
ncbi:MAG: Malate synthase [uncultured Chloroflexi bacterium]|uniref:Malate synthase n=1 Tax=uncultured Chloroflexota bacterium TaxID=166587 RepID=A0A6J4GYB3_9CHLR|nr:MAG: Malate synthase [uncultured Chloroflexota bacterium]